MTTEQIQSVSSVIESPWTVIILGGIVDITMRVAKTQKPSSLLYVMANLLVKVAALFDKVLQRTVESPADKK